MKPNSVHIWRNRQLAVESTKISLSPSTPKFPLGFESMNPVEEFMEGGIAMVAGAFVGKLFDLTTCNKLGIEYSHKREFQYIAVGAAAGYVCMAMVAGPLIHELTGASDVKWGPFK